MTSVDVWAAVAGLVSVFGLLLEYLRSRKSPREVSDALAKINTKLDDHAKRVATIESWKNS